MNCKPGDLAYVCKLDSPNYGKMVEVLRERKRSDFVNVFVFSGGFSWIVRAVGTPLVGNKSGKFYVKRPFLDSSLRPIRDNDGKDETLTWAGKPKEVIHELSTTR